MRRGTSFGLVKESTHLFIEEKGKSEEIGEYNFMDFPPEILTEILIHSNLRSIQNLSTLNSRIKAIFDDLFFWKQKVKRRFPKLHTSTIDAYFTIKNHPSRIWLWILYRQKDVDFGIEDFTGLEKTVYLAAKKGDEELVDHLLKENNYVTIKSLAAKGAAYSGNLELLKKY